MGATASKEEEVTVLLGGLQSPDNHKETILYKLKLGTDANVLTIPSIGGCCLAIIANMICSMPTEQPEYRIGSVKVTAV